MASEPRMKLYHTGIIVEDLDRTMDTWGSLLGMEWMPPLTSTVPLRTPEGVFGRDVRFTYSLRGPHFVELLEQRDPSPYLHITGDRHVHHLGYFTDDLRGAAALLESKGYRMELSGIDESDGGIARATFHYSEQTPGIWLELVSWEIAQEIGGRMREAALALGIPWVDPFQFEED